MRFSQRNIFHYQSYYFHCLMGCLARTHAYICTHVETWSKSYYLKWWQTPSSTTKYQHKYCMSYHTLIFMSQCVIIFTRMGYCSRGKIFLVYYNRCAFFRLNFNVRNTMCLMSYSWKIYSLSCTKYLAHKTNFMSIYTYKINSKFLMYVWYAHAHM